jgi:hypothetical protein
VQRCHDVKVGDVHCHEAFSFHGDDAVKEHFGHYRFRGGGGDFAWIVDSVSSNSELCSIGLSLFGSYCAHELPVSNVLLWLFWYLLLVDELDGVGGVLYSATNAVCQSSKFVGR